MSTHRIARTRTTVAAAGCAIAFAALLSGCGSGAAAAPAAPTGTAPAGSTSTTGAPAFPGATGQIADLEGATMQVQGNGRQTAVVWTEATTFTDQVPGSRDDLAVGDCIQVRAAGEPPTDPAAAVAAGTVTIGEAVDGTCTGGFGGMSAGGLGQMFGQRPEGAPAPGGQRPDGAGRPGGAMPGGIRGGLVNGVVTAISGDTVTVEMRRPGAAGAEAAVPSRTVALSASTTYTETVAADADALKVGRCVTALGAAASTGTLTATSIAVRPASDGGCTQGFGGRGFGAGSGTNG